MSVQLHSAMAQILAMPYFKNQPIKSGGSVYGHEDAVAAVLDSVGFNSVSKSKYSALTKSILREWSDTNDDTVIRNILATMPAGSYIKQPAGSQGFPDILIKDHSSNFVALECKSGESGLCPMWNDNVPKQNAIYILSSGEMNATTVFMGRDVITPQAYELLAQQEAEIEQIVQKYNLLMSSVDIYNRGWIQKSRKQHFQQGGSAKTNYFEHADRAKCEANVLQYAHNL